MILQVTLEVLERLLSMIDELKDIPPLIQSFTLIKDALTTRKDLLAEINRRNSQEGYQRVRKVVAHLPAYQSFFEELIESFHFSYFIKNDFYREMHHLFTLMPSQAFSCLL